MTQLWEGTNYQLANNKYKIRLNPILQFVRRHEISPFPASSSRSNVCYSGNTFYHTFITWLLHENWLAATVIWFSRSLSLVHKPDTVICFLLRQSEKNSILVGCSIGFALMSCFQLFLKPTYSCLKVVKQQK